MERRQADDVATTDDVVALQLEVLRLRDRVIGAEAEIGELTTRLSRLDAQRQFGEEAMHAHLTHATDALDRAREREREIMQSTSWRLGQAIVRPLAALKRALGGRST